MKNRQVPDLGQRIFGERRVDVVRPDGFLDPHRLPRPLGALAAVGAAARGERDRW